MRSAEPSSVSCPDGCLYSGCPMYIPSPSQITKSTFRPVALNDIVSLISVVEYPQLVLFDPSTRRRSPQFKSVAVFAELRANKPVCSIIEFSETSKFASLGLSSTANTLSSLLTKFFSDSVSQYSVVLDSGLGLCTPTDLSGMCKEPPGVSMSLANATLSTPFLSVTM